MKKLFTLIALMFAFTMTTNAQSQVHSGKPRFGTAASQDKTYRNLACQDIVVADTLGTTTDTIILLPTNFTNQVSLTVNDSVAVALNPAGLYRGDRIVFNIFNTSGTGHCVYFTPYAGNLSRWIVGSSGVKIALTSAKKAQITFMFDGFTFNEENRLVQ